MVQRMTHPQGELHGLRSPSKPLSLPCFVAAGELRKSQQKPGLRAVGKEKLWLFTRPSRGTVI